MFNNLIESSSHAREFKRRGSFVLFTTGIYAVLFIVAGVASIYAYDARLEDQNLEFVTMLSPTDFPEAPAPERNVAPQRTAPNNQIATRQIAMASVSRPEVVPQTTSAKPNVYKPLPPGRYAIGPTDFDPPVAGGSSQGTGDGTGPGNGTAKPVVEVGAPPPLPDPPVRKPPPVQSKGVVNGLAISLPKPAYPAPARIARVSGPVNVQVLIDEHGKVVSAKAVAGNPLLMSAAVQAALNARFSPTKLGDQPVKVSGVITYNFVLQ